MCLIVQESTNIHFKLINRQTEGLQFTKFLLLGKYGCDGQGPTALQNSCVGAAPGRLPCWPPTPA